ncbi:MAG TPA: hypothetical protein VH206_17300 [Xanthobacteraceae bacterium]|jgi:hypothetical protein|nr:hypothetical protein [Xanthobacteraceae bacterium]
MTDIRISTIKTGNLLPPDGTYAKITAATDNGSDINLIFDAEGLRDIVPLAVTLAGAVHSASKDLRSYQTEGLQVLYDEKTGDVFLKIGLQVGAPMMTFEIPPPLLETLKEGLALVESKQQG